MEITPATKARLENELTTIEEEELPHARTEVVRAQAAGDIMENPDVRMALDEVGRLEARAGQIHEMLKYATIVEAVSGDRVGTGLLVDLRFGDDEVETYLFGTVEDRHAEHDVLSSVSPIGEAVTGRKGGDVVTVSLAGGPLRVEVVGLRPAAA